MTENEAEERLTTQECWIAGASLCAGVVFGLTAMYLFDPRYGKLRRRQIRDQAASKLRQLKRDLSGRAEDVINRTTGPVKGISTAFDRCLSTSDDLILDRVRSRLGHLVPYAAQLKTEVRDGVVALRGLIKTLAQFRSGLRQNADVLIR
jgi:hypothetical protein